MTPTKTIFRTAKNAIHAKFSKFKPIFLHVAPTRKCNIACRYCYQHDDFNTSLSLEKFSCIIEKIYPHGLSVVSFTGGEPTLWKNLTDGIKICDKLNIFTQLTSNGIGINNDKIASIASSGLNYLSISTDSVENTKLSPKTLRNSLPLLLKAKEEGMLISSNIVLNKSNKDDIFKILDTLTKNDIPASIGIAVSPLERKEGWSFDKEMLEPSDARIVSEKIINAYKKFLLLDPIEYFQGIAFEDKTDAWDCHTASNRSIHISPDGDVLRCLKRGDKTPYTLDEILHDPEPYRSDLKSISSGSNGCNKDCYSNCGFSSYYYYKNPIKLIGRMKYMY